MGSGTSLATRVKNQRLACIRSVPIEALPNTVFVR